MSQTRVSVRPVTQLMGRRNSTTDSGSGTRQQSRAALDRGRRPRQAEQPSEIPGQLSIEDMLADVENQD